MTSVPSSESPDFVTDLVEDRLSWRYRRMLCDNGETQIREVYFRDDAVAGWVDGPAALIADSPEGLVQLLDWVNKAMAEDVLVDTELPGYERCRMERRR